MSQVFHLRLATDNLATQAQQLDVSIAALSEIRVSVHADISQTSPFYLQLHYQINMPTPSMAHRLEWPVWQSNKVGFADYLWEETCLECFISAKTPQPSTLAVTKTPYIEINASPDGRYALYQFDDYRHPDTLPPPALMTDLQTRATLDWPTSSSNSSSGINLARSVDFERYLHIPVTPLPHQQYAVYGTVIEYLHPCVILWLDKTALYFAPSHATPPDFHNRQHWGQFVL